MQTSVMFSVPPCGMKLVMWDMYRRDKRPALQRSGGVTQSARTRGQKALEGSTSGQPLAALRKAAPRPGDRPATTQDMLTHSFTGGKPARRWEMRGALADVGFAASRVRYGSATAAPSATSLPGRAQGTGRFVWYSAFKALPTCVSPFVFEYRGGYTAGGEIVQSNAILDPVTASERHAATLPMPLPVDGLLTITPCSHAWSSCDHANNTSTRRTKKTPLSLSTGTLSIAIV